MDAKTWAAVKGLLADVASLPLPEREQRIREQCDDPELRAEVLQLAADPAALSDLLEQPALAPGTRIGVYVIESLLGRGGMGEVYRARDPKLNRVIAIKVLPATTAADLESRARFEREAQSIAALNHPNIVTIHSVEEAEGLLFLTMEYVDGKPLSNVIGKGGLSLTQILTHAIPLADAISAAHQKGIIHRDLKPANVMLSTDGRVKVLDFGVAKLMEVSAHEMALLGVAANTLTGEGRIVGTVAYMSPEQSEGKPVDSRSDLFSLGVMLYEMATGQLPFKGETKLSVLSAIVRDTPRSVTDLNPAMPREFARVVKRCLAKEKERRYQTAVDVRNELEELRSELESGVIDATVRPPAIWTTPAKPIKAAAIGAGAALIIGGASLLVFKPDVWRGAPSLPAAASHRQITFVGDATSPAISRDGKFVAFITGSTRGPQQKLFVQEISGGQPLQVFEGDDLRAPVWSNDGSELIVASSLRTPEVRIVPRLGGPTRGVRLGVLLDGLSWSPDNARFAGFNASWNLIMIVDKKAGTTTSIPITGSFAFLGGADWSPTGDLLLFQTVEQERYAIRTIRTDGSGQEKVFEGEHQVFCPRWSPTGDAIYYLQGGDTKELMELPVSLRTGRATGSPHTILAGLQAGNSFTISNDGRQLAYTRVVGHANVWLAPTKLSPDGISEVKQLTSGTAVDADPSISPDGRKVAFSRGDGDSANIFLVPIEGGNSQQITFRKSRNLGPVWSPEGSTIAFGSTEGGQQEVWHVSAGGGTPRAFEQTRVSTFAFPFGLEWAPGSQILYEDPGNQNFQVLNPVTGEHRPLVEGISVGYQIGAHSSPDGSQVAVFWNRPGRADGLWVVPIQESSKARLIASDYSFGPVGQSVDASSLRGREVTLVAHVRTNVSGPGNQGQCWIRVQRPNQKMGFLENMDDRPIQSTVWTEVTITGKVDDDAERVGFGCFLEGMGQIWVDDIQLRRKNVRGEWEVVPIKNPGFEETDDRMRPAGWHTETPGYVFQITEANPYEGKRSVTIKSAHVSGHFVPIGWSSDGRYVYAIEGNHRREVVMIRGDGAEIAPLIDLPLPERFSTQGLAITPDGRRVVYAAYQGQSDVWIVRNFDNAR